MAAAFTCPSCGRDTNTLIGVSAGKDGKLCCSACHPSQKDMHVYTGRKMWLGSEVHGKKKLLGDELRSDTEAAMLSGDGSGLN